jgi:hypothetical protein
MGFTHYFPQARPFTAEEWAHIREAFQKILNSEVGHLVAWGYDEQLVDHDDMPPQVDNDQIRFNGIGPGGHENFVLLRNDTETDPTMKFKFCKTAMKEYDIVVCMLLIAINDIAPDALRIATDGRWDDEDDGWVEARHMYLHIFGKSAVCPFAPKEKQWRTFKVTDF